MLSVTGIAATVRQSGCDAIRCIDGPSLGRKIATSVSLFETKCSRSSVAALGLGVLEDDRIFIQVVFHCGYTGQMVFSSRDAHLMECSSGASKSLPQPLSTAALSVRDGHIYSSANGSIVRSKFPYRVSNQVPAQAPHAHPALTLPCRSGQGSPRERRSGSLTNVLSSPLSFGPSPGLPLGASLGSLPRIGSSSDVSQSSAQPHAVDLQSDAMHLLPGNVYHVALAAAEPPLPSARQGGATPQARFANQVHLLRREGGSDPPAAKPGRGFRRGGGGGGDGGSSAGGSACGGSLVVEGVVDFGAAAGGAPMQVHAVQWCGESNVDKLFAVLTTSPAGEPGAARIFTVLTETRSVEDTICYKLPGELSAAASCSEAVLWFTGCANGYLHVCNMHSRHTRKRREDASKIAGKIKVTALFAIVAHTTGPTLAIYDHALNPVRVFIHGVSEGLCTSLGCLDIFHPESRISLMEFDEASHTLAVAVNGGPVALLRLSGTVSHTSLLNAVTTPGAGGGDVVCQTDNAVGLIKNTAKARWVPLLRHLVTRLMRVMCSAGPSDANILFRAMEVILGEFDDSLAGEATAFSGLFQGYFTYLLHCEEVMKAFALARRLKRDDWMSVLHSQLVQTPFRALAELALASASEDRVKFVDDAAALHRQEERMEYSSEQLEDFLERLNSDASHMPDFATVKVMSRVCTLRRSCAEGQQLVRKLVERAHNLGHDEAASQLGELIVSDEDASLFLR